MLTLFGAIPPSDDRPCFAQPLFLLNGQTGAYIQVSDVDVRKAERVICITNLSPDDYVSIDKTEFDGSDLIYCFLDVNGSVRAGPLNVLKPFLEQLRYGTTTSAYLKLTIEELIGNREGRFRSRQKIAELIGQGAGPEASKSYIESCATTELWRLLLQAAKTPDAGDQIRAGRSRIYARTLNGKLHVSAEYIDLLSLTGLTEADLQEKLTLEFGTQFQLGGLPPRTNMVGVVDAVDPTPAGLMAAAKTSPRQEERLAILLRAILIYPDPGLTALRLYHDSAQFAETATEMFRKILLKEDGTPKKIPIEITIASQMDRLFTDSYPLRRGELLFYLTCYLSDFPQVNSALKSITSRSVARALNFRKPLIDGMLREGRGPSSVLLDESQTPV